MISELAPARLCGWSPGTGEGPHRHPRAPLYLRLGRRLQPAGRFPAARPRSGQAAASHDTPRPRVGTTGPSRRRTPPIVPHRRVAALTPGEQGGREEKRWCPTGGDVTAAAGSPRPGTA